MGVCAFLTKFENLPKLRHIKWGPQILRTFSPKCVFLHGGYWAGPLAPLGRMLTPCVSRTVGSACADPIRNIISADIFQIFQEVVSITALRKKSFHRIRFVKPKINVKSKSILSLVLWIFLSFLQRNCNSKTLKQLRVNVQI